MSSELVLEIKPDGEVRTLYSECLDFQALGTVSIRRASLVEWNNEQGCWAVTLPDGALLMTGFATRSTAVAWEIAFWERRL
jgi:hypothetical protein